MTLRQEVRILSRDTDTVYLVFALTDGHRAVTFTVYTGWGSAGGIAPHGTAIDYHDIVPHHEGQSQARDAGGCEWTDGKSCYSSGTCTAGAELFKKMLTGGHDAVWGELRQFWMDWFGDIELDNLESVLRKYLLHNRQVTDPPTGVATNFDHWNKLLAAAELASAAKSEAGTKLLNSWQAACGRIVHLRFTPDELRSAHELVKDAVATYRTERVSGK